MSNPAEYGEFILNNIQLLEPGLILHNLLR